MCYPGPKCNSLIFFLCMCETSVAPLLLGLLSNDSNAPLNLSVSFVFCPLSSSPPVHRSVICSSFSFALVRFFCVCYNSHLLFLSQALISHVAVSRQLQTHTRERVRTHPHTHTHAHTCTQPQRFACTCIGMEVIKARSKVCLITRLH